MIYVTAPFSYPTRRRLSFLRNAGNLTSRRQYHLREEKEDATKERVGTVMVYQYKGGTSGKEMHPTGLPSEATIRSMKLDYHGDITRLNSEVNW